MPPSTSSAVRVDTPRATSEASLRQREAHLVDRLGSADRGDAFIAEHPS
jgi:hypothetical protein